MRYNLFQLELIRKIRSFSPAKLVPILFLLGYCLLMLQLYINSGDFCIDDFGILQMVVFGGVSDLLLKFFFQKRHVTFPSYVSIAPISVRDRNLFELFHATSNFWNYYGLILFIPILILFDNVSIVVNVILLNLLISLTNCFVLRIFEKTNKLTCRLAILLLPTYYILSYFFVKNNIVPIWCIVGLQTIIFIVSVCGSLTIKCYAEYCEKDFGTHYNSLLSPIYGMELFPMLRCKRFRCCLIFPILYVFFILHYSYMHNDAEQRCFLLLFSLLAIGFSAQSNFGIEANYWHLFEVSPHAIKEMFNRKFSFFFFFELIYMAICSPIIYTEDVSVLYFIAVTLVSAAFYNLTQLLNFLFIKRLDVWQSSLLNHQGTNMLTFIFQTIPPVAIMVIAIYCEYKNTLLVECVVFLVLGIVALLLRQKAFNLFYKIYRKNRYNIINRFVK